MTVDLFSKRSNRYSQNGEDGMLQALFEALGISSGYFVEFGAWDGKHWSNCYARYEDGWTGCFIEGLRARFDELCINIPDQRILKLNTYIEPSGPNSLDEMLARHGVQKVDLLSIDIDSDDLAIWESVSRIHPAVVIIEFNATMPFDTRYRNPPGRTHGNSALALYESGKNRGYELIDGSDSNLIFLDEKLAAGLDIRFKTLQEIRDQTIQLRYFFGNDGSLLHDFKPMNEVGITEIFPIPFQLSFGLQPIPSCLRRVRIEANYLSLLLFGLKALIRCPGQLFRLFRFAVEKVAGTGGVSGAARRIFDKDGVMSTLKSQLNDIRSKG